MNPVAAKLLGSVAGDVGARQQFGGIVRLGSDRHQADAGADLVSPPLPAEAVVANRSQRRLGDDVAALQRTVLLQQGKFIATDACQRIALAEGTGEQRIDLFQQLVACGMPGGVVDYLELVEIDVAQHVPGALVLR
ncbi:MAG: hypothetical protein AW07_02225 [Candidatus Accumulibacter sp. SK-11]|nr:MAG: hypothetical protein AW07_02225 [Candidatus Accumulibacter sp. SK-11]